MALVEFEVRDSGAGHLRLNDPERLNAMSAAMAADFEAAVRSAQRSGVRAVVLSGAGRGFSAGGDLAMLDERRHHTLSENRAYMLAYYQSFLGVRDLHVPLVAALHGPTVGAGACLACACDLRVAGPDTTLAFPFTRLGLHPGMGITGFLPALVGPGRATELLLTGRRIDASQALAMALVHEVVEDPLARALALAEEILQNGPLATEMLLATLRQQPNHLVSALQTEATAQAANYQSAEFAEGLKAARDKRKPQFSR